MADLKTNNTGIVIQGGTPKTAKIADGVTLAVGGLIQRESGYANHWDEAGVFLGIVVGGDSRADDGVLLGETSDDNPPMVHYRDGATLCHLDSIAGATAETNRGDLVYSADSDTDNITVTDTTNPPIGFIKEWRSATDVDVELFTEATYRAGIADASWSA